MADILVRRAGVGDTEAVSRVHEASWRAGYLGLFEAGIIEDVAPERCSISVWRERLSSQDNEQLTLVAERDESSIKSIIGFVQFGLPEAPNSTAEIMRFYVTPAEWAKAPHSS